jgi:hypothetical protein
MAYEQLFSSGRPDVPRRFRDLAGGDCETAHHDVRRGKRAMRTREGRSTLLERAQGERANEQASTSSEAIRALNNSLLAWIARIDARELLKYGARGRKWPKRVSG